VADKGRKAAGLTATGYNKTRKTMNRRISPPRPVFLSRKHGLRHGKTGGRSISGRFLRISGGKWLFLDIFDDFPWFWAHGATKRIGGAALRSSAVDSWLLMVGRRPTTNEQR
jgi:hypothetical protein